MALVAAQPSVQAIVLIIAHAAGPPIWKAGRGIAVGWFAMSVSEATYNMLTLFLGDDTKCNRLVADSVSFLVIAGMLCTLAVVFLRRSAHSQGPFTRPPPVDESFLSHT